MAKVLNRHKKSNKNSKEIQQSKDGDDDALEHTGMSCEEKEEVPTARF